MTCSESLRAQAYFDGELDALSAAELERHAEHCENCTALLESLESTRNALRRLTPGRATPELRARIIRALDQENAENVRPAARAGGQSRSMWRPRPFWAGVLGGVGASAAAAAFFLIFPVLENPLLDELVSAHLRSLMPSHLVDVVSTDRHTVKPWFSGRTDISPVVADFAQAGYQLIGGRADYLDHQRAAVVVYQHGPHVINVFSWGADRRTLAKNTTRNGYRMAFWKVADVQYCAVSDTGWDELLGLVRLLQKASAPAAGTE